MAAAFDDALRAEVDRIPGHKDLAWYAVRAGHRTRPIGCLLACSAAGGDWRAAMPAAIAAELVHKSSVIRDDIADDDGCRSGQDAVHVAFGIDKALALSDVLWSYGVALVVRDLPAETGRASRELLLRTIHEMALGQLEDVAPSPMSTSVQDRVYVDELKTGALSGCACALGALAADAECEVVVALERYGRRLGTAFQIFNDVRNLRGSEQARAAQSDVLRGRDTVVTAFARANGSPDARRLVESILSHRTDEAVAAAVREVVLSTGADELSEETAHRLLSSAAAELAKLPDRPARDVLLALTKDALLAYAF